MFNVKLKRDKALNLQRGQQALQTVQQTCHSAAVPAMFLQVVRYFSTLQAVHNAGEKIRCILVFILRPTEEFSEQCKPPLSHAPGEATFQ